MVRLAWPLQGHSGSCSSLSASGLFRLHGLACMTPSPACADPAGPKCAAGHAAKPPAALLLFASPLCTSVAMYVCCKDAARTVTYRQDEFAHVTWPSEPNDKVGLHCACKFALRPICGVSMVPCIAWHQQHYRYDKCCCVYVDPKLYVALFNTTHATCARAA